VGLDSASWAALWQIASETGVAPEYLLPVLYHESGFNPSVANSQGAPYYGINQASADLIAQYANTDPDTYMTWPASRQLSTVVRGYIKGLVSTYGPIRSATRLEQANFLPATLNSARNLDDVITRSPSAFYTSNSSLDADNKGFISVRDIARAIMKAAQTPAVQNAIATAYAARGGGYTPAPPAGSGVSGVGVGDLFSTDAADAQDVEHIVYGDDYGFFATHPTLTGVLVAGGIIGGSAAIIYGIETGYFDRLLKPHRPLRRRRRA
jgi:hypothetical protein